MNSDERLLAVIIMLRTFEKSEMNNQLISEIGIITKDNLNTSKNGVIEINTIGIVVFLLIDIMNILFQMTSF